MGDLQKRPTGRVPGVPVPASPATVRANRVRNWKHGQSAKSVTLSEATEAKVREIHPDAPEILKAYTGIITDGDQEGRQKLVARNMAAQEIILRRTTDQILTRGEIVEEVMIGPDGDQIGVKLKANPLLEHFHQLNENLGYTAEQQEMTPKSRREGQVNAAEAHRAAREARLLGSLSRIAERRERQTQGSIETTAAK